MRLLIEFPTGKRIYKIDSRTQAVIQTCLSDAMFICLSHDKSFRAALCPSAGIKYTKICETKVIKVLHTVQLNLTGQMSICSPCITQDTTDESVFYILCFAIVFLPDISRSFTVFSNSLLADTSGNITLFVPAFVTELYYICV